MKRIIMIALVLVMVAGLSLTAFAENGGFVDSPSKNLAPEIGSVEAEGVPEGVVFELESVSYADVDRLSDEAAQGMKDAYEQIKNAEDITTLTDSLKEIVEDRKIESSDLAIADLFDLSPSTEEHGEVTVALESDYLKHFVALLHMYNGVWTVVENAVVRDGKLHFSVDDFSPFAIVVDASGQTTPPAPTNNTGLYVGIAVAVVVIAAAAVGVTLYLKKKKIA